MNTAIKIGSMLKITLQVILVILYIFLDELVWKKFAVPIRDWFSGLSIMQKLQVKIENQTAYETLGWFLVLFAFVEILGIYAGILMVSGAVIWGVVTYATKIPIAAFAFWIFNFSEQKLLTIDWFATIYNLLLRFLNWIKSRRIYRKTVYSTYLIKRYLKKLFKTEGSLKEDIKRIYDNLKPTITKQ